MVKKPRTQRTPDIQGKASGESVRSEERAKAAEGALGRLLTTYEGTASPFMDSPPGSDARAFAGAQRAIDAAIRLTYIYVSRVSMKDTEEVLASYYMTVIEWVEGMRRDRVDIPEMLTRLQKLGGGYHAHDNIPGNA